MKLTVFCVHVGQISRQTGKRGSCKYVGSIYRSNSLIILLWISKRTMAPTHKDVPDDDSFGSVQASVGRFSALTGILGAWFLFFIALGFVAYGGVRVYQTQSNKSDQDKKVARTWLFWSGIAMAFCVINLFISWFWKRAVDSNKGFAEVAGTMSEIDMLKSALSPPVASSSTFPSNNSTFPSGSYAFPSISPFGFPNAV